MTLHPFDTLPLTHGASLVFTPCPGTKSVDLDSSIVQLKQAGVQAVITLMPDEEMNRFDAQDLPAICAHHGLGWFHLPVEDDAAPTAAFDTRWAEQQQQVHQLLDGGGTVAIHCRGGSGRTGLMAAIILMERGIDMEQAVTMVKGLRPGSLKLSAHQDYLSHHQDKIHSGGN